MTQLRRVVLAGFVAALAAFPADAAIIDFQDQTPGDYLGETVTLNAGGVDVTFAGGGLTIRDIQPFSFPPGSSRVLSTAGDTQPITVTFESGFTTDFVQIRNWIYGSHTIEVDFISMTAFDSFNMQIGTITSSAEFINLSVSGIAKLVFDDARDPGDPDAAGDTGYVLDEFEFNAQPVPEPTTLALVGAGLVALRARRRRTS